MSPSRDRVYEGPGGEPNTVTLRRLRTTRQSYRQASVMPTKVTRLERQLGA